VSQVQVQAGQAKEALATVRRWVESDPGNPAAHDLLGDLLAEQGDQRTALKAMRTASRLHPEEPRYLRKAATLCRRLRWFDEARESLNRALELAPEEAATHVERGLLALEEGDEQAALRHYEEAISLEPADATAYYQAGMLYRRQKEYDRAVEYLRQATRLRPGYSEALVELAKVTTIAFMTRRFRASD
jgi:tetratricopeptide (TPR) repeat protein